MTDVLGRAVELTIAGSQSDFPVLEEGRPVGVLRQADLLAGLSARGPECEWRSVNKQCGGSACPFHR